jgi:hypothetical protein
MKKQGLIIMSIVIAVGFGFTLTELMIYAIIAQDRFKQDGHMVGVISGKSSRKRLRGNVISLSGQIIGFTVELLISICALVKLNLSSTLAISPTFYEVVVYIQSAILSVTIWVTSTELQRHLWGTTNF